MQKSSGYADISGGQLYYEVAGEGQALVFIHAGVADRRMWDDQVDFFADRYRVVRYDMRGFGNTKPATGEFSDPNDLAELLAYLQIGHAVLIGCSMGGFCAMDFTLEHPGAVDALVMVGSGPTGLDLDVAAPVKEAEAEQAEQRHDWERLIELAAEIWYDGEGRGQDQVNAARREYMKQMQREALPYRELDGGRSYRMPPRPAAQRLAELHLPVLIVCGVYDTAYIRAASDYMEQHIAGATKVMVESAHLPSMDRPAEFNRILDDFLTEHIGHAQG